jgi:transaldolase
MTEQRFAEVIHNLVFSSFHYYDLLPVEHEKTLSCWQNLKNLGTHLWLDTGDVEQALPLWNKHFEALTTNNTLLNKEIQKGIYDELISEASKQIRKDMPHIPDERLIMEIAFFLNASHGMRLVRQFDAHVSVELHTDLADNVPQSIIFGRRFHQICPDMFFVKVPMSPAGFIAARKLQRSGIRINFTLGFSARQNYLAACISNPSFVNVFMGRLNAFVADNDLGDCGNIGEKATIATQREILELRKSGKSSSRLIGASMRDGKQVEALAGIDVMTMPLKVAAEFENMGIVPVSQVKHDPKLKCRLGVLNSLWNVPDEFKECVKELVEQDIDQFSPESFIRYFHEHGFGDLFPELSARDLKTIRSDGKTPVYEHWQPKLENGDIGLDALMNISALQAFAEDQKALDKRIKSIIF